ncbi:MULTISPECIES: hypothetical protein [Bradyrhizobium]|jgi:hypothetical protein|uniref:hypothetical protein n=1 Tax=Bradyrhizobium TaxID=374 RepID=UPI00155579C9|nr:MULTISPECIES: hypothetical protein [Bradyrhizobium]NPV19294.1 hypothetical protein [Bradyrhizobium aeschynomenes]
MVDHEAVRFTAPSVVKTPTSPNTDVVATPTGDTNNTTQLVFEYQGRIPVWTPVVSQAQPQVVLGADITIGATTWRKGITVQYAALGSTQYTVTIISGEIVDDRGLYSLQGVTLGIFPISSSVKAAPSAAALRTEEYPRAAFTALPTVNTPTSPNSNVVTTPSGDTNNTTYVSFQYQGRIPVWTPIVSQSQITAVLGADITIGATTWKAGITVQYAALGSAQYTVTIIKGDIIDDRALYSLAGTLLGIFPIG